MGYFVAFWDFFTKNIYEWRKPSKYKIHNLEFKVHTKWNKKKPRESIYSIGIIKLFCSFSDFSEENQNILTKGTYNHFYILLYFQKYAITVNYYYIDVNSYL